MRAHDQSSIFSIGGKFRPDYGLLLELHALTLVARSYALLSIVIYPKSFAHEVVYFSATYLKNGGVTVLKKTLPVLDLNSLHAKCSFHAYVINLAYAKCR